MSQIKRGITKRSGCWPALLAGCILFLCLCISCTVLAIGGTAIWVYAGTPTPEVIVVTQEVIVAPDPIYIEVTPTARPTADIQQANSYKLVLGVIPIPNDAKEISISANNTHIEYDTELNTVEVFNFYLDVLGEQGWTVSSTIKPEKPGVYGLTVAEFQEGGEIRIQIDDFSFRYSEIVITVSKLINK